MKTLTERIGNPEQIEVIKDLIKSDPMVGQAMAQVQKLGLDREVRRQTNKRKMNCLVQIFGETATAVVWLKTNVHHETIGKILTDYDHVDTKMADWLEDKIEAIQKAFGNLVETMKKACGCLNMSTCLFTRLDRV